MTLPPGSICLRGVHKSFRAYHADSTKDLLVRALRRSPLWARHEVLRGVDLSIAPGERVGIVGRNGAGKSTLFRVMSGILAPDSGDVAVVGRIAPIIEVTAGFVPDLTAAENLRLNACLLGLSRRAIEQRFDSIVSFAGLGDFTETPVRFLSSGMTARLGFSIAAHVDADILLVDEVLAVGDATYQRKCIDRMFEISRGGATIVFVSHDLEALRTFCTRIVVLDEGRISRDSRIADAGDLLSSPLHSPLSGPG
ncbi:MAG: ABC transporter ATP-binding protein [Deltaproteobacteria bacterium]|nr:ABC transporter ATP-binding protein [Deltaproteobacteria bacterium]